MKINLKPLNILFTLITCCFSFALSTCSSTEPEDIQPGKRDYIWTLDSVDWEGRQGELYFNSMWGSSEKDIWAAGFSSDLRDCLWHYDGIKWKRAIAGTPITNPGYGAIQVAFVWGTAQNDVWATGTRMFSSNKPDEPFVMHFDGIKWTEVQGDKTQMPDGGTNIIGIEKDHFWITSNEMLYRYRNNVWKKFSINKDLYCPALLSLENEIYITAYTARIDSLYLMKLSNDNFEILDKSKLFNGKFGAFGLMRCNEKIYTFADRDIFSIDFRDIEIVPGNWKKEVTAPDGFFINSVKLSSKDFWVVGTYPYPYHYNGTGWDKIDLYKNISISQYTKFKCIWGNGRELFINDCWNNRIFHGR